jgi:hypothetical protein
MGNIIKGEMKEQSDQTNGSQRLEQKIDLANFQTST